jgi:calnexin
LIVKPDQSFQIQLDGSVVKNGTLLEDFTPSVNPEKEIDDPKDEKPDDWVDTARIPDPDAKKPEDWDEDASFEIVDEEAQKPDDWLEDEASVVPDPEAVKPEDWDDEEDGDWTPPTVPNPKCDDVSGCGKWEKPMKRNPTYKGKWTADYIDNPAYKGPWAPRKIANPDYYEDKTPSNFEPIGAIGFEIWTMQNDILFDNIYVGHSVEDAEKLKAETFDIKQPIEKKEEDAAAPPAPEKPASPMDLKFKDDPIHYIREKVDLFVTIAKNDPVQAIKFVPEVAGGLGALLITALALVIGIVSTLSGGGAPPQVQKAKETVKQKVQEVKESVAETSESEKPRATRRISKKE